MTKKIYTLASYENGGMNPMDERATFTDKNVAFIALAMSNDQSALTVDDDEVEAGEISGWRKIDGKICVFSIKGEPWLNLALLCGSSVIEPIKEEKDGITTIISAGRILRTIQSAAKAIDRAQSAIEKGKINGTQQVRV